MAKAKRTSWCRHYDGIFGPGGEHEHCKAGVRYDDVRTHNGRNATYVCFDAASAVACPHLSRFTPEEEEVQEKRVMEYVDAFESNIANGVCPECSSPMVRRKVGQCVYASPCGHRLYQGDV